MRGFFISTTKEVHPPEADNGTAPKCGRVGSCHIYLKKPFRNERLFYFPFVISVPPLCSL